MLRKVAIDLLILMGTWGVFWLAAVGFGNEQLAEDIVRLLPIMVVFSAGGSTLYHYWKQRREEANAQND